jgi:hypothetical protein
MCRLLLEPAEEVVVAVDIMVAVEVDAVVRIRMEVAAVDRITTQPTYPTFLDQTVTQQLELLQILRGM